MNQFQTPYHLQTPNDFDAEIKTPDTIIQYDQLAELTQGGPVTGNIRINGHHMEGRYGGPLFIKGNYVYLPMLEKKLFADYFRLVRIDRENMTILKIGDLHHLIWIEKVKAGKVYFYDGVDQARLLQYSADS